MLYSWYSDSFWHMVYRVKALRCLSPDWTLVVRNWTTKAGRILLVPIFFICQYLNKIYRSWERCRVYLLNIIALATLNPPFLPTQDVFADPFCNSIGNSFSFGLRCSTTLDIVFDFRLRPTCAQRHFAWILAQVNTERYHLGGWDGKGGLVCWSWGVVADCQVPNWWDFVCLVIGKVCDLEWKLGIVLKMTGSQNLMTNNCPNQSG